MIERYLNCQNGNYNARADCLCQAAVTFEGQRAIDDELFRVIPFMAATTPIARRLSGFCLPRNFDRASFAAWMRDNYELRITNERLNSGV